MVRLVRKSNPHFFFQNLTVTENKWENTRDSLRISPVKNYLLIDSSKEIIGTNINHSRNWEHLAIIAEILTL